MMIEDLRKILVEELSKLINVDNICDIASEIIK